MASSLSPASWNWLSTVQIMDFMKRKETIWAPAAIFTPASASARCSGNYWRSSLQNGSKRLHEMIYRAKAAGYAALQRLRQLRCPAVTRNAFGVRRIPPLCLPASPVNPSNLQRLRQLRRPAIIRKAFGVRRIPPLCLPASRQLQQANLLSPIFHLLSPINWLNLAPTTDARSEERRVGKEC